MNNILVNISEENETIRGCFDTETPTLEKILDVLDKKASEVEELKIIIKELKEPKEPKEPYNPEEDFMYVAKKIKEENIE